MLIVSFIGNLQCTYVSFHKMFYENKSTWGKKNRFTLTRLQASGGWPFPPRMNTNGSRWENVNFPVSLSRLTLIVSVCEYSMIYHMITYVNRTDSVCTARHTETVYQIKYYVYKIPIIRITCLRFVRYSRDCYKLSRYIKECKFEYN